MSNNHRLDMIDNLVTFCRTLAKAKIVSKVVTSSLNRIAVSDQFVPSNPDALLNLINY